MSARELSPLLGRADDGTPILRADTRRELPRVRGPVPSEFFGLLVDVSTGRTLKPRGIDSRIWAERGCRYYQRGDPSIKEEFRPFLPESKLGTVTRIVNQCNGWLMPKHAPPGFPPIPPQLRPDRPVILDKRTTWHYHGPQTERDDRPVFPEEAGSAAGKYLPKTRIMFGVRAESHVSAKGGAYDSQTGEGQHNGVPIDVVHQHTPHAAKYVLLGEGSRIDLHPWAALLLPKAKLVFFVLEGTPKTDAVLSAGGVAFGVPSVTCWDPEELTAFARAHLQDKKVLIVPDADWFTNWQVERQALKVRTVLRRIQIDSYVCAPPYDAGDRYYKGIDDFLGAGNTLGDLMIEGREPPLDLIAEAVSSVPYQRRSSAARALENLALYVDSRDGTLTVGFQTLKRMLDVHHSNRVLPLLDSIKHTFTVKRGSLETIQRKRLFGRYVETMWRDTPTIGLDQKYFQAWAKRAKLLNTDFFENEELEALRTEVEKLKSWRRDVDRQAAP